ncbi:MAG: GNAT family N-acetyltransferase [Promethearchaeota archaeon]
MKKEINLNGKTILLREYEIETDPVKLTKYLYDKSKTEDQIQDLKTSMKEWYSSHHTRVILVAEFNQEIIASLMLDGCLGPTPNEKFNLYSVVTAEHFRGTGISQLLFSFAKEWVKKFNARILLVETWSNNYRARKYYEKLGFIQYGCLPKGLENRQGEGYVDEIFYFMNIQNT